MKPLLCYQNFSETDIIKMFGFHQTVDMLMGTNCTPLLTDLFHDSIEAYFIQGLRKKIKKKLARPINCTFCYIDDVLSLSISKFGDFVDRIYPIELEIKIPHIQIGLLHALSYT